MFCFRFPKVHYNDPPRITRKLLRKLHRLPRLQNLYLSNTEGVEIDGDDLADLIRACPSLEKLTITGTATDTPELKITLVSLVALRNTYPIIGVVQFPSVARCRFYRADNF